MSIDPIEELVDLVGGLVSELMSQFMSEYIHNFQSEWISRQACE